jgi:hypothetical protein
MFNEFLISDVKNHQISVLKWGENRKYMSVK